MNFHGQAKKLADIDLPRIGHTIGVGEDELHMVLDVETRGGGFDRQGRPKMLFEPHIFWRELGPGPKRDAAVEKGLAYPKWGHRKYPRDSYPRLLDAMEIDRDAALRSASWGLGQIMGFNCKLAGYGSAEEMVTAFLESEGEHLAAMVQFIVSAGLDDELRDLAALDRPTRPEDTVGFVRGYNGSGYKKNRYHIKAAAAHNKWRAIRDTPFEIDRVEANPNEAFEPVENEVAAAPAPAPAPTPAATEAPMTRPRAPMGNDGDAEGPRTDVQTAENSPGVLGGILGKYAPKGSKTSLGGYALILVGAVLWLAQGPFPALAPVVELLSEAKLIQPDATGMSLIVAGFFAVTGRAALR